jgi:hypothetical protein
MVVFKCFIMVTCIFVALLLITLLTVIAIDLMKDIIKDWKK